MSKYKQLKDLLLIIVGNIILAFGVGVFLLPSNILSGGVAGVAVLLEPFLHLSKTIIVTVTTYSLFVLGFLCLGRKFALQTLLSSLLYPILLNFIASLNISSNVEPLLAAIYGGLLAGAGIAIVIRTGASTGGMDIPPLIVHKYTHIEVAKLIMAFDGLTVLCGLFIYGLEAVLIGLISVYTTSIAISKVMSMPGTSAKTIQIISDKWQEINQDIIKNMNRGTTISKGIGGYTKEEKNIIYVVVGNNEYGRIIDIVNKYDKNAFMIVNDATEVHGEGFSIEARV